MKARLGKRGSRRILAIGFVVIVASAFAGMATAGAKPVKLAANTSGDTRAVYHSGNVQPNGGGNNDVGCTGGTHDITSTLNYTIDSTGTFITINPPYPTPPFSVIVKGGPAYNVYSYPPNTVDVAGLSNLHAPVNNGGNIAGISHWFVCGNGTPPQLSPLTVFAGYADDGCVPGHLAPTAGQYPSPWAGDTGVTFDGTVPTGPVAPGCTGTTSFDAGAIRIHNPNGSSVQVLSVDVKIGATDFPLWNSTDTIAAGGDLILTQTQTNGSWNFDTSDLVAQDCSATIATVPHIFVTTNAGTTDVADPTLVLTDLGQDKLGCGLNESIQWTSLPTTVPVS